MSKAKPCFLYGSWVVDFNFLVINDVLLCSFLENNLHVVLENANLGSCLFCLGVIVWEAGSIHRALC